MTASEALLMDSSLPGFVIGPVKKNHLENSSMAMRLNSSMALVR